MAGWLATTSTALMRCIGTARTRPASGPLLCARNASCSDEAKSLASPAVTGKSA